MKIVSRVCVVLTLAAALSSATRDAAASPTNTYAIPESALGDALNLFAVQSRRHILFLPGSVSRHRASALRGVFSSDEALRRLLKGSGLGFRVIDGDTILITSTPPERSVSDQTRPALTPATVEPLVVTALRRSTLGEDTPMAITAFTGQTLATLNLRQPSDLAVLTPGLTFGETGFGGQKRASLRGVYSPGEATVSMYYDETPMTGPSGSTVDPGAMTPQFSLYDVKRVEVLKGAQGTLYGAGAMGGTIRVLFNTPDAGAASGEAAVRSAFRTGGKAGSALSAMANAPLIPDRLAVRIVGYRETDDGYVDQIRLGRQDTNHGFESGVRVGLGLYPRDGLSLTASAAIQISHAADGSDWSMTRGAYDGDRSALIPFDDKLHLYALKLSAAGRVYWTATSSYYRWTMVRRIDTSQPYSVQRDSSLVCASYFALSADSACDAPQIAASARFVDSWTPAIIQQPLSVEAAIHELRAAFTDQGPWSWTGGIYVEDRRDSGSSQAVKIDPATGEPATPLETLGQRTFHNRMRERAVFGEASYALTSNLTATLGVRFYEYRKRAAGSVSQANPIIGQAVSPLIARGTHDEGWSRKAMIAYRPTPGLLVYGQMAEGFRPGGVNAVPGLREDQIVYRSDQLRTYEAGFKRMWGEGLTLNIAAYRTDWRDMQYNDASPNGAFYFIGNLGAARIAGAEAELEVRPIPTLRLKASTALIDSRLRTSRTTAAIGAGAKADRLPFTPQTSLALTAHYERPIRRNWNLNAQLSAAYRGQSQSTYSRLDSNYERLDGAWLVHGGLGLEVGPWAASLLARNLLNDKHPDRLQSSAFGLHQATGPAPRTITVELRRAF